MKVTRKQLRRLILNEVRIKPSIPYASEEQYAKIADLARDERPDFRSQADSFADALGYDPDKAGDIYDEEEGEYFYHQGQMKSFSDELRAYENLNFYVNEIRYLYERLDNSNIASFVMVYKSDLENKFNTSYDHSDLEHILRILHHEYSTIWQLKFDYRDDEYYFLYADQML